MQFHIRGTAAPLLVGLVLALAGCGGGGGGGGDPAALAAASAGSPAPAAAASGSSGGLPSGLGVAGAPPIPPSPPVSTVDPANPPSTPAAEVRYTLGPSSVANDTTVDFQTLVGMAATGDGGYRIVWFTATFDAAGAVQRDHFEQRYDAAGRRVGGETAIAAPTEDLSGSRDARVQALGGGYLQFGLTDALRAGLRIQHFAADGTALDAPIELGGAAHGWSAARLALANGAVAITWQPLSSVGPGEMQTALLTPAPR